MTSEQATWRAARYQRQAILAPTQQLRDIARGQARFYRLMAEILQETDEHKMERLSL